MSKRTASKPARINRKQVTKTKRTGSPKVTARAERKKQVFVQSPKVVRPAAAASLEPPVESHAELKQTTSTIENRALAPVSETIEQAPLPNGMSQKLNDNDPKQVVFSSGMPRTVAYRAKLLEAAQADMQFAFELVQRLATIKSPLEYWAVVAEFTGRRIIMIGKHSKELAAFWAESSRPLRPHTPFEGDEA